MASNFFENTMREVMELAGEGGEIALRRALKAETGSATVIIVAQRLSTILHADQILVLDGGRIVGRGTHSALLRSCETYREIALSQLSAAELGEEG